MGYINPETSEVSRSMRAWQLLCIAILCTTLGTSLVACGDHVEETPISPTPVTLPSVNATDMPPIYPIGYETPIAPEQESLPLSSVAAPNPRLIPELFEEDEDGLYLAADLIVQSPHLTQLTQPVRVVDISQIDTSLVPQLPAVNAASSFGMKDFTPWSFQRYALVGSEIDTVLDVDRTYSWGTTLAIRDSAGAVVGFLPALKSNLVQQPSDSLRLTYTEEFYQAMVYTQYLHLFQTNPDVFSAQGITSLEAAIEAETNGNMRAYLEYIQHSQLHAHDPTWNVMPYQMLVGNQPSSSIVATTDLYLDVFLAEAFPGTGINHYTVLNSFSDPNQFLQLNKLFTDTYGKPIWDLFGMFRPGTSLAILPGIQSPR
ncbi:hypothetical protein LRY65_01170 [Candidatus Woesebacteria bacterium]|nr:hypothetical protein [Candidatus Woesebacteria bacterium]MCD8507200.1 hypothetical protein [Candidatus Woesebacteria bacterium]MCD8526804.1 hypothetical protein [Candidatus Woesebacteria bacterium]MCD8545975.1 hypothetical protein [Candidatus Woesebacteria bacterium]